MKRNQFEQEGYLVVRSLISGDELYVLDRMVDLLLNGLLKPEVAYKDWLPEQFYTFWEPGMKDRTDLPRPERVRLMSNMYHHHSYFRSMGGHPRIYNVVSSLLQSCVQMFSDTVFMKPA